MLLETQQNSDITYRVYDYDRLSNGRKRELHIEKSIDVINAPASPAQDSIHNFANVRKNKPVLMEKSAYYKVWKLVVEDGSGLQLSREKDFDSSYLLASVVAGSGYINGTAIKKGDHFIVTNECDSLSFSGDMEIILSAQI